MGDRGRDRRSVRSRLPAPARLRRRPRRPRSRAHRRVGRKLAAARGLFDFLTRTGARPAEPRRARCRTRSRHRGCPASSTATRRARCSSGSRPRPRSRLATGRCSSWPTPRGCAAPSWSASTSTRSTSTRRRSGSAARAARSGSCRSASPPSGRCAATSSGSGRRSPTIRAERALLLSKSGRRLSPSDVTRRLGRWVRRGGDRRPRLAARAAPLLRHPHARGRRRPALDPGAARARQHLDDPDLHARRAGPAARGLRGRPSACLSATCN